MKETRLKVILHAPDADAYQRACNNARNILKVNAETVIMIILNAKGVAAALDAPACELDEITWLCPVTLSQLERTPKAPMHALTHSAAYEIACLQSLGWAYIRS